jgi:uncharacterized protein (DUF58 family)
VKEFNPYFDRALLAGLLVFLVAAVLFIHMPAIAATWLEGIAAGFAGALLALVKGSVNHTTQENKITNSEVSQPVITEQK